MLTEKCFKENLLLMSINFDFKIDDENGAVYMQLIYSELKDKTNDEIMSAKIRKLISTMSLKEWNGLYGFRGRPALRDMIDYASISRRILNYHDADWKKMRVESFEEALNRERRELGLNNKKIRISTNFNQ